MANRFSVNDHRPWNARIFTIWGGQAFSIVGSQLVQFALIWYLTVATGSATVMTYLRSDVHARPGRQLPWECDERIHFPYGPG